MLLLLLLLKLVCEIALMAMLGQGALALIAGPRRESLFVYRLLQTLTSPWVKAVRRLTPALVLDRHVPLAAFAAVFLLWLAATAGKIGWCIELGVAACR